MLSILMPMNIANGSSHIKSRQLKALVLLVIAFCVMLTCLTQRASMLHQMQMKVVSVMLTDADSLNEHSPPSLSICQLSAHSLNAAQPLHFDTLILFPALLLLVLATRLKISTLPPAEETFRPLLRRIHLMNCVFRE